MANEEKKRTKLTVSNLGKSALRAGAGTTPPGKYEDCHNGLTTYYNDTGTMGTTLSKK